MNRLLFCALLGITSVSIAASASKGTSKGVRPARVRSAPVHAQPQLKASAFVPVEPRAWSSGTNKVLEIKRVKKLYLTTPLVSGGKPAAVIATPSQYLGLANALQEQIRAASGVTVPIIDDAQLASEKGIWTAKGLEQRQRHLIVFGNVETSRLIPILYARNYTEVDAGFPGENGHVLQTVHDPWGNGHNVVIVGGSDQGGVRGAARALSAAISKLPRGGELALPRLMEIRASQQTLKAASLPATIPDAKAIARTVQQSREAFAQGQHTGVTRDLVRAAHGYARTGADAYAELYKQLARLMIEIYRSKPTTYGGPWGMDADFNSTALITGWDVVEESPAFTEAERLEITKIVAEYASYVANYGNTRAAAQPGIRHNHNTFPNLGTYFAAEYFGKYYQAAEAERWLANADACFQAQIQSFKPQEDANGYQWLTMQHVFRYALARPDHKIFTNGNARAILDLSIVTMDNMGWQSPFGDVGGIRGTGSQVPLLAMGAWYYRDASYCWALQKMMPVLETLPGRSEYAISKPAPVAPSSFFGARVFPISEAFFDYWSSRATVRGAKPWVASLSEAFEKATFRAGFDEQSHYLLLDGIGCGGHRHFDGNAIIRYSDRGRQWIADGDYIESLPKFHTSVLVYRDGQSESLPPFCALEAHADLASAGMVRSAVRSYAGVDWSRSLVWLKDIGFVAMDSLKAVTPGDYSFRAVWHTIGEPRIEGSRYTVEQKGERMVIDNVDGARLKLEHSEHLGRNLRSYPHADPVVRILQQVATRTLARDESYHFLNFFGAHSAAGEIPVKTARASDTSMLVTGNGKSWLVGVTEGRPKLIGEGIVTDADVYAVNAGTFCLAHARFLARDGQTLLQSDAPVSTEIDWANGKASVHCAETTTVTLAGQAKQLPAGHHSVALSGPVKMPAFSAVAAPGARVDSPVVVEKVPLLKEDWMFPGKFTLMWAADVDGDYRAETVVADGSGRVCCIGPDGKLQWEFQAKSPVRALWAGQPGVAAGCEDGAVHMLDASGRQRWTHKFPYYKRAPIVRVLFGADVDGDKRQELICGTESWHFYALNNAGGKLWQFECVHDATCGAATDFEMDGKQEVLAGTRYYSWHGVAPDGRALWHYRTPSGPHATCVASGDLDGSNTPEVVFGGADGNLHVLSTKGASLWLANTGDEVTDVAIAGKQVFAASTSFNLFAFDGRGRRLWRRERPDVPNSIAVFGSKSTPMVAAGCEDGSVAVYSCDGMLRRESKLAGPVARIQAVEETTANQRILALLPGQGVVALAAP